MLSTLSRATYSSRVCLLFVLLRTKLIRPAPVFIDAMPYFVKAHDAKVLQWNVDYLN